MEYRVQHAETAEEKAKELSFTGLGLTSRKNLCLNPEVRRLCTPLEWCNPPPNF